MMQLEYVPGIAGQSVQLDGPSAFVGIAEEMRSREWDYDLGYRDLVTATRPARTVDVTFNADYATADELRRVADADVMARTPGTFVAQKEWKQRGYILASDVDDIHYGRLSTGLKIALLDGAWWRLAKRSFVPEITTPEYRSATGETVTASGASGAPLHALTVDGKAVQDGTPTPSAHVPIRVVEPIRQFVDRNEATTFNSTYVSYNETTHEYTVTYPSGSAISSYVLYFPIANYNSSHIYALLFNADLSNYVSMRFHLPSYNSATSNKTTLQTLSNNGGAIHSGGSIGYFAVSKSNAETTEQSVKFSAQVFDLTEIFGAGNEPSTIAEFKQHYPLSYYQYNAFGINVNNTLYPIDLQGNVLASLPDGTKDVLTVDSTGAVTLEKRVGVVDLGVLTWTLSTIGGNSVFTSTGITSLIKAPSSNAEVFDGLCSHYYAVSRATINTAQTNPVMAVNTSGHFLAVPITAYADAATFKTDMSGVLLYYELATPQTIDLGYIDMPAIPLDAQISVTAAVTPTITAEWQISRDAYLDYPHDYEYDYQKTSSTADVTPSVLTPSDVYLAVFGPAVNPYVIVGGNRYQVNVTVPAGGYLVVNGRDKTIQLTLADGTVQNVFSSGVRGGGAGGGSYIFERIPAGTSEVTYDGSFGFDLGWYEEEGEPPWNPS